jgi:hypothetical protein
MRASYAPVAPLITCASQGTVAGGTAFRPPIPNPMAATAMWDNGRVRSMDTPLHQQASIRESTLLTCAFAVDMRVRRPTVTGTGDASQHPVTHRLEAVRHQ